jgi:hypothetical protein
VLLGLSLFAACGGEAPAAPGFPDTPAGITGRITAISSRGSDRSAIRVEFDPSSQSGPKALVTVTSETVRLRVLKDVTTLPGPPTDLFSLEVGQWVRVWFKGPVLESYPVQGSAAAVVIDSVGVGLENQVSR